MKTKELIALLQEEDPSGEAECCVYNMDIHYVDNLPAYYDGILEVLERDPSKAPYYNICGAKYTNKGRKIKIVPLSITDAIGNDVNLPVDYSEISKERAEAYRRSNDQTREAQKDIDKRIEYDLFSQWAKEHARMLSNDMPDNVIADFFETHISVKSPIPEDIVQMTKVDRFGNKWHLSYVEMRALQWSREICISFDGMDFKIEKRNMERGL